MIDLILLFAIAGAFYGGFWLGAKYHTLSNLCAKVKEKIKGVL